MTQKIDSGLSYDYTACKISLECLFGLSALGKIKSNPSTVDDDNVCTTPILADKDILEFVQSLKNVCDADSDDEKEMNNADLVLMSSKMRNIMKSMCSYLGTHSNGEIINKMDDIEQFDAKK
ncbi:hypothetical protein TNCV_2896081 [Trichonephila clavipes]|nr:hypothetical protein TNCV_2896081 [Trichonephila clavipes]